MIKGLIQQDNMTVVNKYALNAGAPQYTRQMLTTVKRDTDHNAGDFNTPTDTDERIIQTEN